MLQRWKVLATGALALLTIAIVRAGLLSAAPRAEGPSASARPMLVLVSIDGLKPEAVIDAEAHGLRVPNLRALMRDGSYAQGVRGVLPTMTYPSHATLLTGASPARHGIYTNTTFDPLGHNDTGWYWYAEDMRAQSLWDAAADANLTTGNIYWPTSVGARITYNLPQIWRSGTADDLKLQHALSTPGLEQWLGAGLGAYPGGEDETVADDRQRARYAIRLLQSRRPDFTTVYLTGLDSVEHETGPFSREANAALEQLDGIIGQLRDAAEHAAPGRAYFCVVSDHGFAAVQHAVNLYPAFVRAGLIQVDSTQGRIIGWKAMPWAAGGSVAVMLADPADQGSRERALRVLQRLASSPANGIERILDQDALRRAGGFPDAAFLVALREGYELGFNLTGATVTGATHGGMHGYLPDTPAMRAAFFIAGPGIPANQSLGLIDMRRIAPTLAGLLQLRLRDAETPALALSQPDAPGSPLQVAQLVP